MSVRDIVNIQITKETTPISQAGFGTLLILGTHKKFTERIRYYQDASSVLEDGFTSSDPEYLAAEAVFAQSPSVTQIAIGRRAVDEVTITVTSATQGDVYKVKLNGEEFSYTAQALDAVADIGGALVAAINLGDVPVTAVDQSDGSFKLQADDAGFGYTVELTGDLSMGALVASDTVTNDLAAVQAENDDFYGIVITSRDKTEVELAAAFAQANTKIFGTASSDPGVLDAGSTTDIAALLQAASYDRAFVLYHQLADTTYPEAAWFGRQLPTAPGSTTWAFKLLNGVAVSPLTATERQNVLNKKANTYERRAGQNITKDGTMAIGEYIDVIRGIDWLEARITEDFFALLVRAGKISFTNKGIAIFEAKLRQRLTQAVEQGVLSDSPAPQIIMPRVENIPENDRANRRLEGIRFTATLAGAVHYVEVRGVVSI